MKNQFFKILLFLILVFSVNNKVNALIENCGDGKEIKLRETSLKDPGYFEAEMPICKRSDDFVFLKVDEQDGFVGMYGKMKDWVNFNWVRGVGTIRQKVYAYRDDNKGFAPPSEAPLCLEPSAKGWSTTRCEWEEYTAKVCKSCTECYKDSEGKRHCYTDPCCKLVCPPNDAGAPPWGSYNSTTCARRWTVEYGNLWLYESGGNNYTQYPDELIPLTFDNTKARTKTLADGTKRCKKDLGSNWCNCLPKYIKFAFLCPQYSCKQVAQIVGICTPTFKGPDNESVYCINPSKPFAADFTEEQEYLRDESFNVKDCESSYATLDCGFANIIIESEWLKSQGVTVNDKTVELALRLWSRHNNQNGFDRMSISNKQYNVATKKCDQNVYYMRVDGEYINVFKETHKYLLEVLLDRVTKGENKLDEIVETDNSTLKLFEVTCDEKLLGVACGTGSGTKFPPEHYKMAIALAANTILGNDYMQAHLNELFKGEINEEIRSVRIVNATNTKEEIYNEDKEEEEIFQYVEIRYEDLGTVFEKEEIKEGERIYCTEENLRKYKGIEPYCQVEVQIIDSKGTVIDVIKSGKSKNYCTKDYCRIRTVKFAICDLISKYAVPLKVKIERTRPKSGNAIAKFVSCSNPVDNQVMYGFDNGETSYTIKPGVPPSETENKITDIIPLTDYKCYGYCDHFDPRENIKKQCDDDNGEYDKAYKSSIKDPSLRCILNMSSSSEKSNYNFSDEFGLLGTENKISVNNKMCKIYCSDEIEYFIADKVKEKSGRIFEYNIEKEVRKEQNINYKFSNIIRQKRTCVSEIYYKNNNFVDSYNWKGIYNLSNSDIDKLIGRNDNVTESDIKEITNWDSLFKVLSKKSLSEGDRDENINKLLYDLMNCNFYTEEEIEELGVRRPYDDKVGNIKELIMKHFNIKNNYGIGTNDVGVSLLKKYNPDNKLCDINYEVNSKTGDISLTDNNCVTMNNINYKFGGPKENDITSVKMNSTTISKNTFENLVYCSKGKECFSWDDSMYKADGSGKEYDYPKSKTNKTKVLTYNTNRGSKSVEIPENDYVMFEIQTEIAFYNDSRFEVKPSGENVNITGKEPKDSENLKLGAYLFPVAHDAYNYRICEKRDFLVGEDGLETGRRCSISQKYNTINIYFRKDSYDLYSQKVFDTTTKPFNCFVDVERTKPHGYGDMRDSVYFRSIDPANVFPSSEYGYSEVFKSNWNTVLGRDVTDHIKSTSDDLITTEDYLQYRITLSPEQIKRIRNDYDKNSGRYVDELMLSCEKVDGKKDDLEYKPDDPENNNNPDNTMQKDIYLNCKSPFLDNLRSSDEYGSIDSNFNGLK